MRLQSRYIKRVTVEGVCRNHLERGMVAQEGFSDGHLEERSRLGTCQEEDLCDHMYHDSVVAHNP